MVTQSHRVDRIPWSQISSLKNVFSNLLSFLLSSFLIIFSWFYVTKKKEKKTAVSPLTNNYDMKTSVEDPVPDPLGSV